MPASNALYVMILAPACLFNKLPTRCTSTDWCPFDVLDMNWWRIWHTSKVIKANRVLYCLCSICFKASASENLLKGFSMALQLLKEKSESFSLLAAVFWRDFLLLLLNWGSSWIAGSENLIKIKKNIELFHLTLDDTWMKLVSNRMHTQEMERKTNKKLNKI